MISASIGLILGCLIGVGCRWFDLRAASWG